MRTLILVSIIVLFQGFAHAQNNDGPSAKQQAEWRRIAQEEGQKTVATSTVKNFFRNKLIFLVIGGVIIAIVGLALSSEKKED
jgi:hypothetical protein